MPATVVVVAGNFAFSGFPFEGLVVHTKQVCTLSAGKHWLKWRARGFVFQNRIVFEFGHDDLEGHRPISERRVADLMHRQPASRTTSSLSCVQSSLLALATLTRKEPYARYLPQQDRLHGSSMQTDE